MDRQIGVVKMVGIRVIFLTHRLDRRDRMLGAVGAGAHVSGRFFDASGTGRRND